MKVTLSKQQITITSLLVATLLSVYLLLSQTIAPLRSLSDHTTSMFAKHLVVKHYTKTGTLDFVLHSPYASHINYLDTTYYQKPRAIVYTSNNSVWHIQSDTATGSYGNKKIIMNNHVKLHQIADKQHADTLITTTVLTYYPDIRYADTPAPVTIARPDSVTHGIGLAADLNRGIYRLLKHSNVNYYPTDKTNKSNT